MQILFNSEVRDDVLMKFQGEILDVTCAKDNGDTKLSPTELSELFLSKMKSAVEEVKIYFKELLKNYVYYKIISYFIHYSLSKENQGGLKSRIKHWRGLSMTWEFFDLQ